MNASQSQKRSINSREEQEQEQEKQEEQEQGKSNQQKKSKTSIIINKTNLDHFIISANKKPDPEPIHITENIIDRDSFFKALIFRATCPSEANQAIDLVKSRFYLNKARLHQFNLPSQPPAHNISAWRFLSLAKGKDGSSDPNDYELQSGSKDDGERWAGNKILKVMENHGTVDAVLIVSRWFGGTMLGPIRFQHIEKVASQACKEFKRVDEISDQQLLLERLESKILSLRQQLNQLRGQVETADPTTTASKIANNTCFGMNPVQESQKNLNIDPTSSLSSPSSSLTSTINRARFDDLVKLNKVVFSREKTVKLLEKLIAQENNKKPISSSE